jgi:hypothetical protein
MEETAVVEVIQNEEGSPKSLGNGLGGKEKCGMTKYQDSIRLNVC